MTRQWKRFGLGVVLAGAGSMLVGCGGDLPAASRLERTRVLGARVVVAGDATRADAQPGETAAVEWLLTGPRAPGAITWAFSVCTAINGTCDDAPSMAVSGTVAPIIVPFTAPVAVDEVRRPLMLGAICEGGGPGIDQNGLPICDAGTTSANAARFQLPLTVAGQAANRHPEVNDDVIEWEGVAWTARAAGDAGGPCDAASGMPAVVASEVEHRFRVITDSNDRESYLRAGTASAALEALQLSNFATDGELTSQYTTVDPSDLRANADLVNKWTTPAVKDIPAAGLTVHFHFVLRDGRGGLDSTDRALCVLAP